MLVGERKIKMTIENSIESLNIFMEGIRAKFSIEDEGHFTVQKEIVPSLFPAIKQFTIKLWYVSKISGSASLIIKCEDNVKTINKDQVEEAWVILEKQLMIALYSKLYNYSGFIINPTIHVCD